MYMEYYGRKYHKPQLLYHIVTFHVITSYHVKSRPVKLHTYTYLHDIVIGITIILIIIVLISIIATLLLQKSHFKYHAYEKSTKIKLQKSYPKKTSKI